MAPEKSRPGPFVLDAEPLLEPASPHEEEPCVEGGGGDVGMWGGRRVGGGG